MDPEPLNFPQFKPGDLPADLFEDAGVASIAAVVGDVDVQLEHLRRLALDIMLHTTEEGWCLHLPNINQFGEEHGLRHPDLSHLLVAGTAFAIKHIADTRRASTLN